MPVGAIIGAGTSLIGGLLGSNAASSAGKQLAAAGSTAATNINQTAATAASGLTAPTAAAQKDVAGSLASIAPYQAAGAQGVTSLASALAPNGSLTNAFNNQFSFNPSDLANTPGYQFQLQQGLKANTNQMSMAGLANSGAAAKSANNYATGLAGTYFQNAFNNALGTYQTNRQNSLYQLSALQNLAGIGQSANSQAMQGAEYQGNVGLQSAMQAGNWQIGAQQAAMQDYMQGQGGAAAGTMGAANAWQNALGGVGNNLQGLNAMGGFGGGGFGGGWGGGGGLGWPTGATSFNTGTGQYTYGSGGPMAPPQTTDPYSPVDNTGP